MRRLAVVLAVVATCFVPSVEASAFPPGVTCSKRINATDGWLWTRCHGLQPDYRQRAKAVFVCTDGDAFFFFTVHGRWRTRNGRRSWVRWHPEIPPGVFQAAVPAGVDLTFCAIWAFRPQVRPR